MSSTLSPILRTLSPLRYAFIAALAHLPFSGAAQQPLYTVGNGDIAAFTSLSGEGALLRAGPLGLSRAEGSAPLSPVWTTHIPFLDVAWSTVSRDDAVVTVGERNAGIYSFDTETGELLGRFDSPSTMPSAAALNADGSVLALAYQGSNRIDLVDPLSGEVQESLAVPAGSLVRMDFSPDGSRIAFGLGSNSVALVNTDGSGSSELGTGTGIVSGIRFLDDGQQILTGGADGTLRLWDVDTGADQILVDEDLDFEVITLNHDESIVGTLTDTAVRFYSMEDGKWLYTAEDAEWELRKFLIFNGDHAYALAEDGTLIQINPGSKHVGAFGNYFTPPVYAAWPLEAADRIVTGHSRSTEDGFTGYAHFWELGSGEWIEAVNHRDATKALSVRATPERDAVVIAGTAAVLVDAASNNRLYTGDSPSSGVSLQHVSLGVENTIHAIDPYQRNLYYWNLSSAGHSGLPLSLGIDPGIDFDFATNAPRLAVVRRTGSSRIYDLSDITSGPAEINTGNAAVTALNADGSHWAIAYNDGTVALYSLGSDLTPTLENSFNFGSTTYWSVALSRDAAFLAVGQQDGTMSVIDTATGARVLSTRFHLSGVNHLTFNDDGDRLFSSGRDGRVAVWDLTAPALSVNVDQEGFLLRLETAAGSSYRVESSPDLVNWATQSLLDEDGEAVANPISPDEDSVQILRVNGDWSAPLFFRLRAE